MPSGVLPGKCTNLQSHWGSEGWSAPKASPDSHLPGCPQGDTSQLCPAILSVPCQPHTPGDHALQVDDIGVVELCHDAGLTQEVPPLLFRVARLQCFDGHRNLPLPWQLQAAVAHLSRLPCKARESGGMESSSASCTHPPTPRIILSVSILTAYPSPSGFQSEFQPPTTRPGFNPLKGLLSSGFLFRKDGNIRNHLSLVPLKAVGQEQ